MRIIIADSGSTHTEWALVETSPGEPVVAALYQTIGLNPLYTSPEVMQETLRTVASALTPTPDALFFYGSGCSGPRLAEVERSLHSVFTHTSTVEVCSDLLGACRALYGQEGKGCACILGTGAIAALYDGATDRMHAASSLGYILGDEGSGAYIGRQLLADFLKEQMPLRLREAFREEFGEITPESAIEHTYRLPFPNRYLASFAPFAGRHIAAPYVEGVVFSAFEAFFRRNVMRLPLPAGASIAFVGSIAWHLKDRLAVVAASLDFELGRVMQSPMEGLIAYHSRS